jgi:putative peptidoglycan lipid II flippase
VTPINTENTEARAPAEQNSSSHRRRLLKSAGIVSAMTLLCRFAGLIREIIMARFFGVSALKSAFDIAFLVPNLFRRLFGEGALTGAFVPVFSSVLAGQGRERANQLAMRVIGLLIAVLSGAVVIGAAFTYLLPFALPQESRWLLPLPMMRILLPYAVLICVAAMVAGMLNAVGRFAVSAFAPFLLNLVWIVAILLIGVFVTGGETVQLRTLCYIILLAGVLQVLVQWPALVREGFAFRPCFKGVFSDPAISRILRLMGPAALGAGVLQINVCIDRLLAFWAGAYGPAALGYAERLIYLPLGIFGAAFMTVLLPAYSRHAASGQTALMGEDLSDSLVNLTLVMAPCAFGLAVLARPLMTMIYGGGDGAFDDRSAVLSARALIAYAPGLLVFSFNKALIPAFYGMQDVGTPTRVSLGVLVLNVALNIGCILLFPEGWKHAGIAVATVVCSAVSAAVLYALLRARIGKIGSEGRVARVAACALAASAIMGWAAYGTHAALAALLPSGSLWRSAAVLGAVGGGALLYAGLIGIFCANDLSKMAAVMLKHRRRGND